MGEEGMKQVWIILPLALGLSACSALGQGDKTPPPPVVPAPVDSCGAGARDYLIGQPIDEIHLASLGEYVRVIRPGDMVTMDFRADRLNIELDEEDVILRLRCG
jgi:hypothetical protein